MKKILSASLALAAVCYGAVSQAQAPQEQPAQTQQEQQLAPTPTPPAAVENKAPLDERFSGCVKNKDCSIQVRLQIIQEEDDDMNNHFQKIHQACADANFQDCIDKQKDDVQAWYDAQENMQKMMRTMQAQAMSGKEPAAGDASQPANDGKQKTLWQKIWPFGENNK